MGHKIAIRDIKSGDNVIRYGNPIGHAIQNITQGEYVHNHNVKTNLSDVVEYVYQPNLKPVEVQGDMPTSKVIDAPMGRWAYVMRSGLFPRCSAPMDRFKNG